ncbi:prepilin peptidase [Candidatus Peregrinibacteria bacterium]|nr:prepilin peptidase [Candidatus Peregrinibacteria bacterium]
MSVVFFAGLGLIFGSFGTVLLERLPKKQSLLGRSRAICCNNILPPWQLIPVLSFVLVRGRCAHCAAAIPWRYPGVEVASAFLFAFARLHEASIVDGFLLSLLLWCLFLITLLDGQWGIIPDSLNIPFAVLGAGYSLSHGVLPFVSGVFGLSFFAVQWLLSRGRWVGSGDVLLGLGVGLALGTIEKVAVALWFSYVLAAIVCLGLIAGKQWTRKQHVPFGPFLAAGFVIAFFGTDTLARVLLGIS